MNEEKNNGLEPEVAEEVIETVAEETVEEVAEPVAEETVEETSEETATEEAAEAADAEVETEEVVDAQEEVAEGIEVEKTKKMPIGVLVAVIAVVIVVAGLFFAKSLMVDKYSKMYTDVTGITGAEVAEQLGMDFEDFVEYYDLPEDISPKTHEYALINLMPASTYIEKVLGTTYEVAHEFFDWDDSITGETPIGEAWDKTPLTKYYGEAYVEEVKTLYGLDESVTGQTLYGEVRDQIEKAMLEQRLAEEAAAAEETTETTDEATAEEAEVTDEPVAEQATEEVAGQTAE